MCFLMTFHQSWCFDVNFISPQFFLRFFCSQCFVSRAQSVATRCSAFGLSMTVAVAMTMLALLCDLLQKKHIQIVVQKYCYVNEGLSSWRRKKKLFIEIKAVKWRHKRANNEKKCLRQCLM